MFILAIVALMALALFKFIRIVSAKKAQVAMNKAFVITQICILVAFLVT